MAILGVTSSNLTLGVGLSYDVATDYATTGAGFTASHVPISKIAWGTSTVSNRVSTTTPLPVEMFVSGGSTAAKVSGQGEMLVTGLVSASGGFFGITGQPGTSSGVPVRRLFGGVPGYTGYLGYSIKDGVTYSTHIDTMGAQGMSGGYPMGATAFSLHTRRLNAGPIGYTGGSGYIYMPGSTGRYQTIEYIDTVGVQGLCGGTPILVSATEFDSRALEFSKDFVSIHGVTGATPIGVTGTVYVKAPDGVSLAIRDLDSGRDAVRIYNSAGGSTLPMAVHGGAGTAISTTGTYLDVAVKNTGFTFTGTINPEIYVKNPTGSTSGLIVTGSTDVNAPPVIVKPDGNSMTVNSTDLDIRNLTSSDVVSVGGQVKTDVSSISTSVKSTNNLMNTQTTAINELKTNVQALQTIVNNINSTIGTADGNKRMRVEVADSTQANSVVSGRVSISQNGSQLRPANVTNLKNGLYIKADAGNTESVFIGSSNVIRSINNGYPLDPGETLFLQVSDPGVVFAMSPSGVQTVHIVGS